MITIEANNGGAVVHVKGMIPANGRMYKELCNAPGEKIILDLREAKRMNCTALSEVMQFQRKYGREKMIRVVLSPGNVREIFEQIRIASLVHTVSSLEEAYRSFEIPAS